MDLHTHINEIVSRRPVVALVLGMMIVLITRDGGIRPETTTIITGGILFIFVLLQRTVMGRRR